MTSRRTISVAAAVFVIAAPGAVLGAEAGGWLEDQVSGCAIWSTEKPQPADGISWSGACTEGKASGHGVLVWWDEKGLEGRYSGAMKGGKADGDGQLVIRDDAAGAFHRFLGRFEDGKPAGNGFLRKSDGTRFLGELVEGVRHVKGIVLTPDGWLIRGEFKDEQPVGAIVIDYTTEDGEHYLGQAENGKRHGFGVLEAADDDFYAGGFANGLPDGPGIYKGAAGDRYAGDFAEGKPNGFGTSIDASGNVIQGRFINGEPEGIVLVTEPDGTQSVTEWKAGSAQ